MMVVYLLPRNFLGSRARLEFWRANPPLHLFMLAPARLAMLTFAPQEIRRTSVRTFLRTFGCLRTFAWALRR